MLNFILAYKYCQVFYPIFTFLKTVYRNVAKDKMLITNASILNFSNPLFSITYLISFFPKRFKAIVSDKIKTRIAHGKNGNRLKPVLTSFDVKSCKEQETK